MDNQEIEYITQLADTKPRFDYPIRVSSSTQTPSRVQTPSMDDYLRQKVFAPTSMARAQILLHEEMLANSTRDIRTVGRIVNDISKYSVESLAHQDAEASAKIKDYTSKAYSSKRLGHREAEADAYISLGVIFDNQGEYLKAIEYYEKYLEINQSSDTHDISKITTACNFLSVDYIYLISPPSERGTIDGKIIDQNTKQHIDKAIEYSQRHLDLAPDDGGRFIALTNLGLCHGLNDDYVQSGKNHQEALRIAIKIQSLYGQSISVGNLGQIAIKKKDYNTATTCFQQQIQLVQALVDIDAEIKAWTMLGSIHELRENYQDAITNYEHAAKLADKAGLYNELRRINCLLGLCRGQKEFSTSLAGIGVNRLDIPTMYRIGA